MIKMEQHKESICFDFGKDQQKQNFFDKAKKCDIIHNNNSVFLHKILSVKNQSLLDYTLKKNHSEIKNLNYSSETKKSNINQISSNRTLYHNQTETFEQNTLTKLLTDINFNSPHSNSNSKANIFNSPKIVVNKNKNLGNINQKGGTDKEKEKENERICLNTYFNKENIYNNKNRSRKENINLNNEYFLNPEISFSNLYTSKYLRKPVVIKFNNNINPINLINNNNSCNNNSAQKINFSMTSLEKEENKDNNNYKKRIKTDERIKPYNFYEKNIIKPELYRSYEDLERKSMEISRRRMKKNSAAKFQNFKKDANLIEVKESLDNFIKKCKSKKKENDINREKGKKNIISKNRSVKNISVIKNKDNSFNSFRLKEVENEKNNFVVNKENININSNYWQEQRNFHYNIKENENSKKDDKYIDLNFQEKIKNLNFKNMENIKSEKVLNDGEKNGNKNNTEQKYCIKKKNININFIEDHQDKNIYNISLNSNDLDNNYIFNNSVNYNNSFNSKKSFIRKKYGKKNNHNINKLFEDYKKHFKNNRKEINRGNKTPIVRKKFIEDYKAADNVTILSYSQSQSILSKKNNKQIKVNKKSNSHKKSSEKNKNLPSILEEEIKNNLNVINGVENMNNFINLKNKNYLKECFKILVDYSNQMKTINYNTVFTNISHNSGMKYIRKIIPINNRFSRENIAKINKYHSRTNFAKKNYFNIEKQKLIILKRKEFGFFERYENCIDFIENFRKYLINYSLNERKNEK